MHDLLDQLRRHRWLVAFAWVVVFVGGVTWVMSMPNVFRSEGKLLVRLGRENVAPDPTAQVGVGPITILPQARETEMNSVVEALKCQALVEQVVDAVTPPAVWESEKTWRERWSPPPEDLRPWAIGKLGPMINVAALRKSNLISVVCDASDPRLAKLAAEKFIQSSLAENRNLYRNPGARTFFSQQAELIGRELHTKEDELVRIKNEAGVGAIDEQRRLLLDRISGWERDLRKVEADAEAVQAEIATLQSQQKRLPERVRVEETVGHPNLAADNMREQLYALQVREGELSSKLTDEHFLLKQVREQLVAARKVYENEEANRVQTREGINRAFEQASLTTLTRQAELESFRARLQVLRPRLDEARQELSRMNQAEVQIARLQREVEQLRINHAKYAQSLEQSRIDDALQEERISNIGVLQQPTTPISPIKPNRPMLLAMVFIVASFAAVGVGLACDIVWPVSTGAMAIESSDEARAEAKPMLARVPLDDDEARA